MSTSISMSGVYGYRPHIHSSSRSATNSFSVRSKRSHTSAMVGPSAAAIHGIMASSRRRRSSAPILATSGHQRLQPVDNVLAQLGRRQHFGVVEKAEDKSAEGVTIADLEGEDDGSVGAALPHRPHSHFGGRRGGVVGVHEQEG